MITKPDLGGGLSHPARYTKSLFPIFVDLLDVYADQSSCRILDPFAGTGRIHQLRDYGHTTVGVELEPEWAELEAHTLVADALHLPFENDAFDAIVTSPVYGNRLSDNHVAKDGSLRRSYRHDLGHELTPGNSGALQWGRAYRQFHVDAWRESLRVLHHEGLFLLNIKDHIRNHQWMDVAGWHTQTLIDLGMSLLAIRPVVTPSLKQGSNASKRVETELILAFRKQSLFDRSTVFPAT